MYTENQGGTAEYYRPWHQSSLVPGAFSFTGKNLPADCTVCSEEIQLLVQPRSGAVNPEETEIFILSKAASE